MAHKEKLFKTTIMVTAVIILSKVFGLARDVITAGYFGTGMENDAYSAAYSLFYLPVLLFNSCITATIVPLYVEERERHSLRRSNHFASNALNLFMLASLIISALMYVFARPLVQLVFRFNEAGIELTVKLTRIMMLGLVFNVASIVISSLLNAMERFISAQLTGFPLSLAVIVAAVCFSRDYGIEAIAWGVFAASVLQVIVLVPSLMGWFEYSPLVDFKDRRFHKLMRLAGPAILSMGVSEINHLIDRSLASGLAVGSISAMNYAYKLITFVLGILMVPLTTVMFSKMSRMAADQNRKGVLRALRKCVVSISLITLPIVAVAMVMSVDVVKMIFMRGSFNMDSTILTSGVLMFYMIGVPAFGLRDFMNRTFHALQDTKTPFRISCIVVIGNVILNLILRAFMGARGLALATSISSYMGLVLMFILMKKHLGLLGFRHILPEMIKIVIATFICAASCLIMNRVLPEAMNTLGMFIRLLAASAVSLIVYLAACIAMRVRTLNKLCREIKARLRG